MMIILVLFFFLTPEKTDTFHLEIDLWKKEIPTLETYHF